MSVIAPNSLANELKTFVGEVTLDGSNPTPVTTGLRKVLSAVVAHKTATAPGDDPTTFTVDYGGSVADGVVNVYAWRNTGGTDPTLIASTNSTAVVVVHAVGY